MTISSSNPVTKSSQSGEITVNAEGLEFGLWSLVELLELQHVPRDRSKERRTLENMFQTCVHTAKCLAPFLTHHTVTVLGLFRLVFSLHIVSNTTVSDGLPAGCILHLEPVVPSCTRAKYWLACFGFGGFLLWFSQSFHTMGYFAAESKSLLLTCTLRIINGLAVAVLK